MADGGGGGNAFLGVLVGALIVAVAGLGFFMFGGNLSGAGGGAKTATINIQAPK